MNKPRNFVLNLIIVMTVYLATSAELSGDAIFGKTISSSSEVGAGTRDMEAGTATGTGASGQGHGGSELAAGSL